MEGGGSLPFDLLKTHLKSKPIHITEGISWVLPTVMSNKVCCEVPTLPLCCDTGSCQKILKSLHELGDGSCNYLSYCLAAAALPHCCWLPFGLVLHLFALSPATDSTKPTAGEWLPQPPCACRRGDLWCKPRVWRGTLHSFWDKLYFSWPGPKPGFALVSSTPKDPWMRGWHRGEHAHPGTHSKCSLFCACVCGFLSPLCPVGSE